MAGWFYPAPPAFIGGRQPYAPRIDIPISVATVSTPPLRSIVTFGLIAAAWAQPFQLPPRSPQIPISVAATASAFVPLNTINQQIINSIWANQDVQTRITLFTIGGTAPTTPDSVQARNTVNDQLIRQSWDIAQSAIQRSPVIPLSQAAGVNYPPQPTFATFNLIIAANQPAQWWPVQGYFASARIAAAAPAPDTTPDQFSDETKAGQPLSTTVDFTPVTPTGFNAATPITASGGLYSINGGSYTSSAGTFNPGDTFAPRNTSSASYLTSVATIITVGGVSATFTSITQGDPSILGYIRRPFNFNWWKS